MARNAFLGGEGVELPRSLWAATAPAPLPTSPLTGDAETEVAIVGAGYTGLSTALHLAEAGIVSVVLDAAEIGWGASGRNNGQVIPGLKLDPDDVVAALGPDIGERLVRWSGEAPGRVFDLIERHGLDCSAVNRGWIQPAYADAWRPTVEARVRQWSKRGAPVEMLDPADVASILGTPAFKSAWLDRRGGSIQPLAYARGLAAAALGLGASIHTRTPVTGLERRGGSWRLATPSGTVSAKHVVVATNAYGGELVKGSRESIVPVRTAQVATKPLGDNIRATILPGGQVASDTRRLLTSFRLSPDGRLVMGGSGATGGAHSPSLERHLHRSARELFGHLGEFKWEFGWSGYLAITTDHLPHLHEPSENLHVPLGCNGRGIALMTAMGRQVAARITESNEDAPLPSTPFRRVAMHGFRGVGIAAATVYKRWGDRRDWKGVRR